MTINKQLLANIKGPKKDTGKTGPTGPKGDKGDTGTTLFTIVTANTFAELPSVGETGIILLCSEWY